MVASRTPKVGYLYTEGACYGSRPLGLVYPNGRVIQYGYSSAIDHHLGRVSFLADCGCLPDQRLVEYKYLGANSIIRVDYVEPKLRCDLAHGSGANIYAGLDRFGRVIDLRWWKTTTGADVERIRHGYDRSGNRLWRENPVATSLGKSFDEFYQYDGVDQLVDFRRGPLNAEHTGLTSTTFGQDWQLDATGNWTQFREDSDGNGTWDLSQPRAHNAANELLSLGGSSAQLAHDRAGNMTCIPSPLAPNPSSLACTYDAWNRLVTVSDAATNDVIATYAYDARTFRITSTTAAETRHFFYTTGWRCIEERLAVSPAPSPQPPAPSPQSPAPALQTVWGRRYIDDLVLRDRGTKTEGILDERLYFVQGPNWNVTAVASTSGAIVERVSYAAYGEPTFLDAAWSVRALSVYALTDLYTGRRRDLAAGLCHYRNRYQATNLGRFLSRDPIGFKAGDTSVYRYVSNSPTSLTDPAGLATFARGMACAKGAAENSKLLQDVYPIKSPAPRPPEPDPGTIYPRFDDEGQEIAYYLAHGTPQQQYAARVKLSNACRDVAAAIGGAVSAGPPIPVDVGGR